MKIKKRKESCKKKEIYTKEKNKNNLNKKKIEIK